MAFKRMTAQQRETYHALRALDGVMTVTPQDARQLHALRKRGLVRLGRDAQGVKVARLRGKRRAVRMFADWRGQAAAINFIGG